MNRALIATMLVGLTLAYSLRVAGADVRVAAQEVREAEKERQVPATEYGHEAQSRHLNVTPPTPPDRLAPSSGVVAPNVENQGLRHVATKLGPPKPITSLEIHDRNVRQQHADAVARCEWNCGSFRGTETPGSVRVGRVLLRGDASRFALITEKLKSSVRMVKEAGVVVYAPVETVTGVAIVRFETRGKGRALRQDVRQTDVTWKHFVRWIEIARQPGAEGVREELRKMLPKGVQDHGKTIFVKDYFNCGLIPASLGLEGVSLARSDVLDGVRKRKIVESTTTSPEDITVFSGYPETPEDYGAVFRNPKNDVAPLAIWKEHASDLRTFAEAQSLQFIGAAEVRGPTGKASVLARLAKAKGIAFVLAHVEGFDIRLPGEGETELSITPKDISGLTLKGAIVVLRLCKGADRGYPQAFIDAGATAVWANYGVINAGDANRHVKLFIEALRSGLSVTAAIKQVEAKDPTARTSTALFSALKKDNMRGHDDVEA